MSCMEFVVGDCYIVAASGEKHSVLHRTERCRLLVVRAVACMVAGKPEHSGYTRSGLTAGIVQEKELFANTARDNLFAMG